VPVAVATAHPTSTWLWRLMRQSVTICGVCFSWQATHEAELGPILLSAACVSQAPARKIAADQAHIADPRVCVFI
jgi:hypothetical protein